MKIPLPIAGAQRHREPQVVGIDLGTTNSLVACLREGRPEVLRDDQGRALVPSLVCYHPDGRVLVGEDARPFLLTLPERTIYSVKRLLGRSLDDLEGERSHLTYRLSDEHRAVPRIVIAERQYTASEVAAQILRCLKSRAEAALGCPVEQTVITVPAYFNDAQRQATRDAGRIAGLDVLRIVNEPTAACLAYGLDRRRDGMVAVYDLGGGTFDVSILKLREGIFEVQSTNGDTHLGGDDMDRAVADWLARQLRTAVPDLEMDPALQQYLRLAAERVRCALSVVEAATVRLLPGDGPVPEVELTRDRLNSLVTPLVERTLEPCRQALADAGVTAAEVDEVVLVGGATRMPLVREAVERLFGRRPHTELNPEEVVALGAGVQAGILAGQVEGLLLLDVNPLSLGLETYGGAVEKLIPRNSTIPTSARQVFTTGVEGQPAIDLHVVQGERELARDNRSLARFQIALPPMPAGWPRLEVTFMVDENGILSVTAYEHRSQAEARVEVRPASGLTEDEVERMVMESFEHAEADLRARRLAEARAEAEQVVQAAEKQLPDAETFAAAGKLPAGTPELIREAVAVLRETLRGEDVEAIRERLGVLEAATRELAALVLDRAVREALRGRTLDAASESLAQLVDGPRAPQRPAGSAQE